MNYKGKIRFYRERWKGPKLFNQQWPQASRTRANQRKHGVCSRWPLERVKQVRRKILQVRFAKIFSAAVRAQDLPARFSVAAVPDPFGSVKGARRSPQKIFVRISK